MDHTVKITGNTVFIPGATSGIGLALALALQGRGNTVIIGGRRVDRLLRSRPNTPASTPSALIPPIPQVSRQLPPMCLARTPI
ncbi:NADP-dependent 3-hydroxy acid dehydrogenase YdfG [Mycobacterium sp. MAA66]